MSEFMHKSRKKRAFTLIELLVVICIISLMLGILLPALNKARSLAIKTNCSSNLRQIYIPHFTYNNEYNTFLPISINDPIMRPWFTFDYFCRGIGLTPLQAEYKQKILSEIQEYKPSYPKKYICPAAKYALTHSEDNLYPMDRSYGLNTHPYYFEYALGLKKMQSTGSRVFITDAMDWWFGYYWCDLYSTYGETWLGFETYGMAAFRHHDKTNSLYWDGHCDDLTERELKKDLEIWIIRR